MTCRRSVRVGRRGAALKKGKRKKSLKWWLLERQEMGNGTHRANFIRLIYGKPTGNKNRGDEKVQQGVS